MGYGLMSENGMGRRWSKAAVTSQKCDVWCTPESRHNSDIAGRQLCANRRLLHRSKIEISPLKRPRRRKRRWSVRIATCVAVIVVGVAGGRGMVAGGTGDIASAVGASAGYSHSPRRAFFARFALPSAVDCAPMTAGLGDQLMRILTIMALTLTLVGCTGDRVKQGINSPQGSVVELVGPSAGWSSWG